MKRILVAAIAVLFSAGAFAAPPTSPSAPPETPGKPFVYIPKTDDVVIGNANAPVTLVEYASLSCPHCAHFYNEILPAIDEQYIKTSKVKLIYRNYPLNEPALKAALLVDCADPDRRHTFISVLFKNQDKWAFSLSYMDSLANIAVLGGISRGKFDRCMNDTKLQGNILGVEKEAEDDYKVTSTPTFFINGKKQSGIAELKDLTKLIDETLAGMKK